MPIQIPKAGKRSRRKTSEAEPTLGDFFRGDPDLLRHIQGRPSRGIAEALARLAEHEARCRDHAERILKIYWQGFEKGRRTIVLDSGEIAASLDPELAREPLFILYLIEQAGGRMLAAGTSIQAAERASAKNRAARAWVSNKWATSPDKGQSKASFGRMYAPLVKKEFGFDVTSDTIARDWLPKGSTARV